MRALVTGSEGFVGRVLCRHLLERGWDVCGCDLSVKNNDDERRKCNLSDWDQVEELLEWASPLTHVFHLAGMTFVPESIDSPAAAVEANTVGTIHLAQTMARRGSKARLIFVGTAEVYGKPQRLPIDETHPIEPMNPYAISKAAADSYCAFLSRRGELDTMRARPFNHTGAGQNDRFVLSSFAKQVAEIEAGKAEPVLRVGNLESARDFSHVRDVVRAYELLALKGRNGEAYNICSGRSRKIKEAMEILIGLATKEIKTEVDPARFRPETTPEIRGSHEKLTADTGWAPEVSFEDLLKELLEDWRGRVK